MIYYLIPARMGSKGWPWKNRILFKYTAEVIKSFKDYVIVSSNDDIILSMADSYGFEKIIRPPEFSSDTADMICVLDHAAKSVNMKDDDIIVLLYLTSPGRTMTEINEAVKTFILSESKSLVCRVPVKTSPYMCIHESGRQVVKHNLYRRQDFPKCYEIKHYIAIYRVDEIKRLNNLLFNDYTTWIDIDDPVDIDYEKDFLDFIESNGGNYDTGRNA